MVASPKFSREKVGRHRERLREQGLRPIQIWVPDTRAAGFAEAGHRQCIAANEANRQDGFMDWLDAASILHQTDAAR